MIHEQIFTCWRENEDESDGKELKATTIRSAAKKAVDIWRHESGQEYFGSKVTVFVKDEGRRVHQVLIAMGSSDDQAPEAFA